MTQEERERATQAIEAALERTMEHLAVVQGLPVDLILAVAHARALSIIATRHGGEVASECARNAADRVAGLPSFEEAQLARMPSQGRA